MEDVKALEKQVLALEEEKKTLQCDAKRLQLTLQEICSKHEKVQERPGSPEIAKKMTDVFVSKKTVSSIQLQTSSENMKTVGQINCNEPRQIALESRSHHKDPKEVITRQNLAATSCDTGGSLEQDGRGPSVSSLCQGQRKTPGVQESSGESSHRISPELRIEAPCQLQGQMTELPARREMSPDSQTLKRPSIRLTSQQTQEPASYKNVAGHAQGPTSPQSQWISSQPQESSNQVHITQPTQADTGSSHSYPVVRRGPPNVSLLPSNKRKRVDALSGSDGLHVVSSNNDYIMHNFKIQKTPSGIDNLRKRLKASVPASGPLRENQAVFVVSTSNQRPGPQLNQSSSNRDAVNPTHISPSQMPAPHLNQGPSNVHTAVNPIHLPPNQIPEPHLHHGSPNLQPLYNPTRSLSNQPPVGHFNQTPSNCQPVVQSARSSSHQIPRTNLNQGSANIQPVVSSEPQSLHGVANVPSQPLGHPHGQLVERVFYPSSRRRQSSTEYSPRVMSPHPQQHVQPAPANGQPVESNGTRYVVREYQVSQQQQQQLQQQQRQQRQQHQPQPQKKQNQAQQQRQQQQYLHQQHQSGPIQAVHAPSSHRTTQFQHIAPAPPGITRNQPRPPVQSPGISSTASLSGFRTEPSVEQDSRGTANHLGMNGVRNDHYGVQLRTPPKPLASIVVVQDGIVLSWNMTLDETMAKIDNYELFACQDGAESTTPPIMWKKIGIVKALPLPMACTLSQFSSGNKYHFAVRAVDDQERAGPFSDPCTISLTS